MPAKTILGYSLWKIFAVLLALGCVAGGIALRGWGNDLQQAPVPAEPSTTDSSTAMTEGARGFLPTGPTGPRGDPRSPEPLPRDSSTPPESTSNWQREVGGWLTRIGLSFAIGFVIGVGFRSFIKTAATLLALAVAALVVLALMDMELIDLGKAQERLRETTGLISDGARELTEAVLARLPSVATGIFGLVVGFTRKV